MSPHPPSPSPVLVVGPFPPPVTGMILVTEAVCRRLRAAYPVVAHDVSPTLLYRRWRPAGVALKLLRYAGLWLRLPWLRWRGCSVMYMAFDSGAGQLFNLVTLALTRRLGIRAVLHHHVYKYIGERSRLTAAVNAGLRPCDVQVFNCDVARRRFEAIYGGRSTTSAVSNSAFVDVDVAPPGTLEPRGGPLRLGHMSVLTMEKGLDLVIALLAALRARDADVRLILAGPAHQPRAAEVLAEAQRRFPDHLEYRGPVSGASKQAFFDDIDLFVFPTVYDKECEPLVLIESLASATPVLTYGRACIGDIVGDTGGLVVDPGDDFVAPAVAQCERYLHDPAALVGAKRAAYERARERADWAARARETMMRRLDPVAGARAIARDAGDTAAGARSEGAP